MFEEQEITGERGLNKATVRILTVLSAFASDAAGFGVTELSAMLGITKNMTFRALTTLVEQGYLVRDASGLRYQLGYRVLELQNPATPGPELRALCAPYMRQLYTLTGETVSLSVRALDNAVFIDGIETRRPGTFRMEIGGLRPLYPTATGRVMLSYDTDSAVEAYLARQIAAAGPGTEPVPQPGTLLRDLRKIHIDGYARVLRMGPLPMLALGFPVLDSDGGLHGAIGVGGPENRFAERLGELLPAMLRIIAALCGRTRLYPTRAAQWEIG